MKRLNSFMALTVGGGDRITYTYDEIDNNGEPTSQNNKANFYVVDTVLEQHINAIRQYIINNKLVEE